MQKRVPAGICARSRDCCVYPVKKQQEVSCFLEGTAETGLLFIIKAQVVECPHPEKKVLLLFCVCLLVCLTVVFLFLWPLCSVYYFGL